MSREEALRNRHMRAAERLSEHTRTLPPLVAATLCESRIKLGPTRLNGTKQAWSSRFDS